MPDNDQDPLTLNRKHFMSALAAMSSPRQPEITDFPIPKELTAIDHGIALSGFEPEKQVVQQDRFRYRYAESLLNQAADLLDRGLRDKAEFNTLVGNWTKLWLDTTEFDLLERVHKDEVIAGAYVIDRDEVGYEKATEEALAKSAADAQKKLEPLLDEGMLGKAVEDARYFSNLSQWSSYEALHAAAIDPGEKDVGKGHAGITKVQTNGYYMANGPRNKQEFMSEISERQAVNATTFQRGSIGSQSESLGGALAASNLRHNAKSIRLAWEAANSGFKRARAESSILINELRKAAMFDSGGPYNYLEQSELVRKRFAEDFRDAYGRLVVARLGLERLYGYVDESLPTITPETPANSPLFEDCVRWTRAAIRFMVAFSQLEQNYVKPLSLRRLVGEMAWNETLKSAEEKLTVQFRFELDEKMFPLQYFVRLRGISAFVESDSPTELWNILVTPPRLALIRHGGDPLEGPPLHELPQKKVPPCRLSRVATRNSVRDPDVGGVASMHNVSPISSPKDGGYWSLEIDRRGLYGSDVRSIRDINLDLIIAMRQGV